MARHWSSGPWQLPTGTFASVSSPSSESSAAFKTSCCQEPKRSRKGCSESLGSARDAKQPKSASTSPLASLEFIPPSPSRWDWSSKSQLVRHFLCQGTRDRKKRLPTHSPLLSTCDRQNSIFNYVLVCY